MEGEKFYAFLGVSTFSGSFSISASEYATHILATTYVIPRHDRRALYSQPARLPPAP